MVLIIIVSQGSSVVSKAKKRISQIDDSVAPLRLNSRPSAPPKPTQETEDENTQDQPSPVKTIAVSADVNPFSVKSDEVQNTQRRSTTFLETIENKSLEQGQKRKSLLNIPEKSTGLTLADLGKKSTFQRVTKNDAKKLPTKKTKPKNKKKTGYALWFETQEGVEVKSGPLKWRHLPSEEKEKWLEQAKQLDNKPAQPTISLVNSFKKTKSDKSDDNSADSKIDDSNDNEDDTVKLNGSAVENEVKSPEKVPEEKENLDTNGSENLESNRSGKRKVSFETENEGSETNPSKTKKLSEKPAPASEVSTGTKSKLAAFQFKKK